MKFHPRSFAKTPLALGVVAVLGLNGSVNAANWEFGDVSVSLDSTFTLGTSIRVESRDNRLIGNSNQAQFDFTGFNPTSNILFSNSDIFAQSNGTFSTNGDLGNLAHDPGEAFSTQLSGTHELDIKYGDFGFFTRGFWFYDFEQQDGSRPSANSITGTQTDLCQDPAAADLLLSLIHI